MDDFRHNIIECQYRAECSSFKRMAEQNGFKIDDRKHCSIYFHPGRRGLTQNENLGSSKFVAAVLTECLLWLTSCYSWNYNVNNDDLLDKLDRSSFDYVIKLASDPYQSFYDIVDEKLQQSRQKNWITALSITHVSTYFIYRYRCL